MDFDADDSSEVKGRKQNRIGKILILGEDDPFFSISQKADPFIIGTGRYFENVEALGS